MTWKDKSIGIKIMTDIGKKLSKLLLVHEPVKWTPEDSEQVDVVTWNMLSLYYFILLY